MIYNAVDPEASIAYLTLGVFAQSVAEQISARPAEDPDELRRGLEDVVSALKAVEERTFEDVETATGLRPFQDYDQVTTLYEVLGSEGSSITLSDIIQLLETMMKTPDAVDSELKERVVRFFDDLALEALQLSRRPSEGIPSG